MIRRLFSNSLLSLLADLIGKVANTLFFILLARNVFEHEAGVFALGLTYALMFAQLSYWGLDQLLTREVAQHPARAGRLFGNFLLIRLATATLCYAALLAWTTWGFTYDPATTWAIRLLGIIIFSESVINLCQGLYIGLDRFHFMTISGGIVGAVKLLGGLSFFFVPSVTTAVLIVCGASILGMLINLGFVYRYLPRPEWRIDPVFWRPYLSAALPFAFIGVLYTIEYQADTVLLSYYADETAVGIYNAPLTLIMGLLYVARAYRDAIYPLMVRLYAGAQETLRVVYETSIKYLLLITLPIAIGTTLAAPQIISLIYRDRFAASVPVLQILIWAFVLLVLQIPSARLMIVAGRQHEVARLQALTLIVNLGLNLLLIPRLGAEGAAWARLASAALTIAVLLWYVQVWICPARPWRDLPAILLAALLFGSVQTLLQLLGLYWLLAGGVAGLTYALILWRLQVITPAEQSQLLSLLQRSRARFSTFAVARMSDRNPQ